ncbi:MAG: hypothetical protein HZA91_12970 [Verrucomicrobia bacterium]|nr:hypothetical protein [Verrucomicrobiota bacterium]
MHPRSKLSPLYVVAYEARALTARAGGVSSAVRTAAKQLPALEHLPPIEHPFWLALACALLWLATCAG